MKIVVPVKRVIDHAVHVRPSTDGRSVDAASATMAINPFCEISLEEAVRLKEQGIASEVIAVTIGEAAAQEQLRAALAVGADRGILLTTDKSLEPLAVAQVLARVISDEGAELAIMGKQAIDSDDNQAGQMLAAMLGWPQATFASEVTIADGQAQVTREVDGGLETLALPLPAVITADLRLNEPRYARLPDIMKARKKTIETRPLEELGLELAENVELLSVEVPKAREPGVRVASVDELVDKLRQSKVIE